MKSFIEANAEESLSFCLIGTINANDAYSKPVMKKKEIPFRYLQKRLWKQCFIPLGILMFTNKKLMKQNSN